MMKFWVYIDGEVPGNYEPEELAAMPGFAETTMVCPAGGDIAERNWTRAGQVPELIDALKLRTGPRAPLSPFPPAPPVSPAGEAGPGRTPNEVLADSSHKIFAHVTELMKELENRRAERALTQSLQRQLIELKNEVLALRERNQYLQEHADLLPAYVDREKSLQQSIAGLRTDKKERDERIRELEAVAGKRLEELESSKRSAESLSADLKRQSSLAEELSNQLAQKEFTLAKAFGVIRRLESILSEMVPDAVAGISREVPGYPVERSPEPPAGNPSAPMMPGTAGLPPRQAGTDDVELSPRTRIEEPEDDPELKARLAEEAQRAVERPLPKKIEPAPPVDAEAEREILDKVGEELSKIVGKKPSEDLDEDEKLRIAESVTELSAELEKRLSRRDEDAAGPAEPPAYTSDSGREGNKTPLPAEGEVRPLPPPWQRKVREFFRKHFSKGPKPSEEDN